MGAPKKLRALYENFFGGVLMRGKVSCSLEKTKNSPREGRGRKNKKQDVRKYFGFCCLKK